jgi:hypothetical protein
VGVERAVKPGEIARAVAVVVMFVFCGEPHAAAPNPSDVVIMNVFCYCSLFE